MSKRIPENQEINQEVKPKPRRTLPDAARPHMFKPGVSGNPKGRPIKTQCLTSLAKEQLDKICPIDPQKRSWGEVLVVSWLQNFIKGNPTAVSQLLDRIDGKLKEAIDLSGSLDVTNLTLKQRAARVAQILREARRRRDEQGNSTG